MTIALTKTQIDWLQEQVDAGAFESLDDAVSAAVQHLMLDDGLEDADLEWAKTLIDEGAAQLDRGKSYTHEQVFGYLKEILKSSKAH
jgi:Arc/MetJ-type ribon-helix-helix transcriptional regulator